MKKKFHFKDRFITFILLVVISIGSNAQYVQALDFFGLSEISSGTIDGSAIDTSSILQEVESRYNIDVSSVQNTMQTLNVADTKGTAPEVSLAFTPSSPKQGEMVTARATPMFFTTSTDKLYYTWYIRHRGCELSDNPDSKTLDKCNEDGDSKITVNDWKMAAMKLIVRGDYDKTNKAGDAGFRSDNDSDGYRAVFGGDGESVSAPKYCYVHDFSSGKNYELSAPFLDGSMPTSEATARQHSMCGSYLDTYGGGPGIPPRPFPNHLFVNPTVATTGDSSFSDGEESFWGSDPNNQSTAQNGRKDEANAVGVGAEELSWVYADGDKIGVAVEGTSMISTKHSDNSYMIMWAWTKNACAPKNISQYTTQVGNNANDQTLETGTTYTVTIPSAQMGYGDFDNCFRNNLIDPADGGQPKNMKVSLSSSPENPVGQIIDADEPNPIGDVLDIQASTLDSTIDPASIWYQWEVRLSKDGTLNTNFNDEHWTNITTDLLKNKQMAITEGSGRKSLKINLNFPKNWADGKTGLSRSTAYLYIKVKTRENFNQDQGRGGTGYIVAKISLVGNGQSIRSSVARVIPGDPASTVDLGDAICASGAFAGKCPVLRNQIIGVSVPETRKYDTYSWMINDKPLECTTQVSSKCTDGKATNTAFFPVTAEAGQQYSVELTMTNSQSGESVTLSRVFVVVDPSVAIEPGDKNVHKKLVGFFNNLDGTQTPDYSQDLLEIFTGQTLKLRPVFSVENLSGNVDMIWLVNGIAASASSVDSDTGMLTLSVTDPVGSVLDITAKGVYYQSQKVRKALMDIWGISPSASIESTFETTSKVAVITDESEDEGGDIGFFGISKKHLGAVISYIPNSVLFALRLALTLSFALFLVGFAQSFLPNPTYSKAALRDNERW